MNWDCIALGNGEILPGAGQGCWETEEPLLWPSMPRRDEDDTLLANSRSKVWQQVPELGKRGLDFTPWVTTRTPVPAWARSCAGGRGDDPGATHLTGSHPMMLAGTAPPSGFAGRMRQ